MCTRGLPILLLVLAGPSLAQTSARPSATRERNDPIVGTWVNIPDPDQSAPLDSIVFRSDGTYIHWLFIASSEPRRQEGTWTKKPSGRYLLEHMDGEYAYLQIRNGRLEHHYLGNQISPYRRVHPPTTRHSTATSTAPHVSPTPARRAASLIAQLRSLVAAGRRMEPIRYSGDDVNLLRRCAAVMHENQARVRTVAGQVDSISGPLRVFLMDAGDHTLYCNSCLDNALNFCANATSALNAAARELTGKQ